MIIDSLLALAVPINSLRALPDNPRRGDVDAVATSLSRFGQRKPIVVRKDDGTIIAGNHTWQAAKQLGWTEIAVAFVGDDDITAQAYALADNRTAELGDYNDNLLKELLETVGAVDLDLLKDTGWSQDAVDELFSKIAAELPKVINEDEVPESPVEPVTKLGDIWQLGRHRLMCGDSNNQATINKLLQGAKLDAIIQDPPYGVLSVEWDRPLSQTDLDIAIANTDGPIMMFNATKPNLVEGVLKLKPQADRIMVWRMTAGITGKGGLFWTWQPVFVWQANRTMIGWDSIEFESASPDRTGQHLTQKPVGLIAKYINAIPNAKNIGDFFMGSGTTLLAAEQTGTNAYGVELEPKYCDVIIQRWETLTGEKAVLISNAESTQA